MLARLVDAKVAAGAEEEVAAAEVRGAEQGHSTCN